MSCWRQNYHRVKASKCCFGADKVIYLGHVVSAADIPIDTKKIEAVASLERPENVEQFRSYLELAEYYGNFVPNFATCSAPHVLLTKKSHNSCGPHRMSMLFFNSIQYFAVPPFSHIRSLTNALSYK